MLKNRVVQNIQWIVLCKIFKGLLQIVVGALSARYLGPTNYGLISYASSLVAFVVPIMQLGLYATLVQEYVDEPDKEGEILGTSLVMNIVSGGAGAVFAICFAMVANSGDMEATLVCALVSISLVFQALELIQCWFHAKLLSKYSSLAVLTAYLVASAYKIYLLATNKGIYWFAISGAVEYAVIGFSYLLLYKKVGGKKICFSTLRMKKLFAKSKYYILAELIIKIYTNTDQVMLKLIVGDAANGFYTTALTCANLTTFLFSAILDSTRPMVLSSHKVSEQAFARKMSNVYSLIIYLALAQSVVITLFADVLIGIMYGAAFQPSVPVLRLLCWNMAFGCIGSVRNIWILVKGKHNLLWIINLGGALINILMNAFMIPMWGACGAALASLLTQFFTNFVGGFLLKPIRPNNRLMIQGLNPKRIWDLVSDVKQEG